ncbi:membrane protein [Klebsiella pneumoniae]|uniref:Membrane protein n=1 Tax=Klebsiella pneumoniae TaxID=573 RepID=A0A2X3E5Z1_KLEPN|nr:membrane protein [Klebsiella pneumoniae]
MEMVLRAAAIYLILLIIFKIAGRRTLMQLTNFGPDTVADYQRSHPAGNAQHRLFGYRVDAGLSSPLVSIDILFGYIKKKFAQAENFLDGTPVIVVENGAVIDGED